MTTNEELTQPIFEEEWAVQIGKDVFTLNKEQAKLLKEAVISGQRGIIWFDKFAISIPHIQTVLLVSRRIKNQLSAGEENENYQITEEERLKNLKRFDEIRRKYPFLNKNRHK